MNAYIVFKTEKHGMKHVAIGDLLLQNGQSIRLQDTFATLPEIDEYVRSRPLEPIYVEGFHLNDGAGNFWITYAATRDGNTLVSRKERTRSLTIMRQTFGVPLLWMYLLITPLWIISFFNIRKVRISLGS